VQEISRRYQRKVMVDLSLPDLGAVQLVAAVQVTPACGGDQRLPTLRWRRVATIHKSRCRLTMSSP
jgi:hypothetical protein